MKISGFTLIRNGEIFDYPYLESLRSLLPLVDELVINVGKGEDQTLEKIQAFAREAGERKEFREKKIEILESPWPLDDPEKKKEGKILSEQTNLALERCHGDWCIYLQSDEVLHEEDYPALRTALEQSHAHPRIEGLLFRYLHFYGSYNVIQQTRSAYRREVRAIRHASGALSVGDAQSFRKPDGSKLRVIDSKARVFHYGWVRSPEAMREKTFFMDQLYHGTPSADAQASRTPHTGSNHRYKRFWGLRPYPGAHPAVMKERIAKKGWHWDLASSPFFWSWGDLSKMVLDLFEKMSGIRLFEYRSYHLISRRSLRRES